MLLQFKYCCNKNRNVVKNTIATAGWFRCRLPAIGACNSAWIGVICLQAIVVCLMT